MMWVYWTMFLVPVLGVLTPRHLSPSHARWVWLLLGIIFALVVGLRHEVGADWFNYLPHFNAASTMTYSEAAAMGDPGHYVLNRWIGGLGGDIYLVNLAYATILMWGTVVFCRAQPNPWLALVAAVPYLVIVVGMGYTRQATALGFAMLGLVALEQHRVRRFVLLIAVGALFHKSAVLLLPIAALAASRNRLLIGVLVLLSFGLLFYLLLDDSSADLWNNYVVRDMQSQGGAIRVAMNAVPAVLLIAFGRRLVPDQHERKLWLWMSVFALVCVPLVWLSSTAVDRIALYLIPLQLYVFARLPRLAGTTSTRTVLVLGIIGYYATVLFVWLNFATHSEYWVPYQLMPLA